MKKLAVALGGGGARGLAHIGFLKILEQEKIKINAISGSSIGAIIGGLYSYFGNTAELENYAYNTIKNEKYEDLNVKKFEKRKEESSSKYLEQFFDFIGTSIHLIKAVNRLSYFDEKTTEEFFEFIPDVPIESLKIKFFAAASDLLSGREIILSNGSLRRALMASAAIPGIFPPVKYENHLLVDGGVTDLVPVRILKDSGYEKIIAVDVVKSVENFNPPKNILEILYRVESISSYHLSILQIQDADILIKPEVRQYNWSDFGFAREIVLEGEKSALQNLDKIKKLYRQKLFSIKLKKFINRIKGK